MLFRLMLLFVLVPFVELLLLLAVMDRTGWLFTISLVVATGILGSLLARSQGFRTLQRIRAELGSGKMPTESLLDALMIFVAGALLLTPGILTDLFGFSLLIPPCRRLYRKQLAATFRARFTIHTHDATSGTPGRSDVIDSYVVGHSEPADGE